MNSPRQAVLRRRRMRGGLGRTLLTAFLFFAIGPLGVMSIYAVNRTQQESERQQAEQMALLASSYAAALVAQAEQQALTHQSEWQVDAEWRRAAGSAALPTWLDRSLPPARWQVGGSPPALWLSFPNGAAWGGALLPLAAVQVPSAGAATSPHLYVEQGGQHFPLGGAAALDGALPTSASPAGRLPSEGNGTPALLYGRAPIAEGLALVALRPSLPGSGADSLAAALVATAILTALVTTIGAALVTRRITRPLYELTRTSVQIARGDLRVRAQVDQDNELGILALAFNTMAEQLEESVLTLEERVAARTEELRQANARIQGRARQLEMSVEIGSLLGTIHELEPLLVQGTRMIADAFDYEGVGLWLLGRRGANVGLSRRAHCSRSLVEGDEEGERALAQRALQGGAGQLDGERTRLAVPLRVADRPVGSLILQNRRAFEDAEIPLLQNLAGTFAVAIENAHAMELEREALGKLQRLDGRRAEFLGEMSMELSTALNSIIGFSQLMLKEVEGPLTDMQRSDLTYINRNGMHLLSLLDGLLDVMDGSQSPEAPQAPLEENRP